MLTLCLTEDFDLAESLVELPLDVILEITSRMVNTIWTLATSFQHLLEADNC